MKWDCDRRRLARKARFEKKWLAFRKWHKVFALFPIKVADGDCRWLEWVERRHVPEIERGINNTIYTHYSIYNPRWEYRAMETKDVLKTKP